MRVPTLVSAGILAALVTLDAPPVTGQDREPKRTLGGHNFVPIELLGDPFVGTYVRNSTGAGTAIGLQVAMPALEGGIAGFAKADISFIGLALEYQQNITNWLAFRLGATGGARLGTSVEALLAEGVTAVFSYGFGLSGQVVRSSRLALAVTADIVPNKAYGISPLDFARSVIDNGLDSASTLLSEGDGRRIVFGLRPAYALTPWLGIQGVFDVGPGKASTEESERSKTQTSFGLGTSVNLMGASNTPLGFTAAYQHKSGLLGTGDVSGGADTWSVGVFYTGRRSFTVGIDIAVSSIGQTLTDDNINLTGARVNLRYDFK